MALRLENDTRVPTSLALLIAVQCACVVFFLVDVATDVREQPAGAGFPFHLSFEIVATFSLFAAIVFEAKYLSSLLRQKARLEQGLSIANAAVHEVIEAHFVQWKLSPSETDIATFLVKGLDIAEIAQVRGCAQGTVKAHLNAIYRKSGTNGRGELLSVIIDTMLVGDQHVIADS